MTKKKTPSQLARATRPLPAHPFNAPQVTTLLKKYNGNLSKVARALGADRSAISDLVHSDPGLNQARLDARERMIDDIEDTAFDLAIKERNPRMIEFLLKTQGKSRGYSFIDTDNTMSFALHQAFSFVQERQRGGNPVIDAETEPLP